MRFAMIAVGVLLSGCGAIGEPQHDPGKSAPPPGVSYRLEPGKNVADLDQRAKQYCQRYGKAAKRGSTEKGEKVVEYTCS